MLRKQSLGNQFLRSLSLSLFLCGDFLSASREKDKIRARERERWQNSALLFLSLLAIHTVFIAERFLDQ